MSTSWETDFNNHALWATADNISKQLDGLNAPTGPDATASLVRVQKVLALIQQHRQQPADMYATASLNALAQNLSPTLTYVTNFAADPATDAHIVQAANTVENVLPTLAALPPLDAKGKAVAAGHAAAKYEAASQAALQSLTAKSSTLQTSLEAAERRLEEVATQSAEIVKEEVSNASSQTLLNQQTALSNYLEEVVKLHDSAVTKVSDIGRLESRANRMVEAVTKQIVADDYQRNARNKAIAGWVWDAIGVVVGATSLGLVGYHLLNVTDETSTAISLSRLAVSVAGLGLAALCFRRGQDFHAESRIAKRTHIRLATVNGFISSLDDKTREALTLGMADQIYLRGNLDPLDLESDPSDTVIARLRDLLEARRVPSSDADTTAQ